MFKQAVDFIVGSIVLGGSAAIVGYVLFDIFHDTYDQLRRKR